MIALRINHKDNRIRNSLMLIVDIAKMEKLQLGNHLALKSKRMWIITLMKGILMLEIQD
jgi:hypothetical protein